MQKQQNEKEKKHVGESGQLGKKRGVGRLCVLLEGIFGAGKSVLDLDSH